MLRRKPRRTPTTRTRTTVLAEGSGPLLVNITNSDADVSVVEGKLLYDFDAELGELLTFKVTGIHRGGVWERG